MRSPRCGPRSYRPVPCAASIIPPMRVALLQMEIAWEDWQANHARAAKLLKGAADGGANLALLPEMFATGFSMDGAKIAQPPGGPTERWLQAMARALSPVSYTHLRAHETVLD